MYYEIDRQTEFGCWVPEYLQKPKYELLRSHYLKANMEQLKVIKKAKVLDPYTYSNDRGYIFYSPTDPPLDKQIIESGSRVFDYNVDHQQKKLPEMSDVPNLDMTQDELNRSIQCKNHTRRFASFDKMTHVTSSKFGLTSMGC